jgi:sugar phosphate permease
VPADAVAARPPAYRWVILGLALLTVATAYGVRNAFGVLLLPLQAAFGWSQSATVTAFTFHWLVFGFTAPVLGGLADRVPPRLMIPIAALFLASSLAVTTQVRELGQFYARYGLVLGAGVCALGMPVHAAISARWFVAQRGLAVLLPLYALAYGVGLGLIGPQLSATAADIFAGPRFGTIYGTFNLAAEPGGASAPWLVGRLVEATGQQDLALACAALLAGVPAALVWLAAPRRYRPTAGGMR